MTAAHAYTWEATMLSSVLSSWISQVQNLLKTSIIRFLITDKRPGRCLAMSPCPASSRLPKKVCFCPQKPTEMTQKPCFTAQIYWFLLDWRNFFVKKWFLKAQKASKSAFNAKKRGFGRNCIYACSTIRRGRGRGWCCGVFVPALSPFWEKSYWQDARNMRLHANQNFKNYANYANLANFKTLSGRNIFLLSPL